jgi:hypothetical protein
MVDDTGVAPLDDVLRELLASSDRRPTAVRAARSLGAVGSLLGDEPFAPAP